jgi:hypothetical protein
MDHDLLSHQLEIRELGVRGVEIILTVVNQGEETVYLREAWVQVQRDTVDLGTHRVSFKQAGPDMRVTLGQFEIAEGHFHLPNQEAGHRLHCRVHLDARIGDEPQTRRISRRIQTGKFTRK